MLFHDATYRGIVKGSNIEPFTPKNLLNCQTAVAFIFNTGFLTHQVLLMQKVVDRSLGVISLRNLHKSIQKNRHAITREIYVSGFGCPYEWETALTHSQAECAPEFPISNHAAFGSAMRSSELHKRFDAMSGKEPHQRRREDFISTEYLDSIDNLFKIDALNSLQSLRNNYVAHASEQIALSGAIKPTLSFDDIDTIHQQILLIESILVDQLLSYGVARDVMPHAPLTLMKGLDQPFMSKESATLAEQEFRKTSAEKRSWGAKARVKAQSIL